MKPSKVAAETGHNLKMKTNGAENKSKTAKPGFPVLRKRILKSDWTDSVSIFVRGHWQRAGGVLVCELLWMRRTDFCLKKLICG